MKKFLAIILALVMVFSMAACGGEDTPDAVQDGTGDVAVDLDALEETDKITLRWDDEEMQTGGKFNGNNTIAFIEVLYDGEVISDYEFTIQGEPCVSAAIWEAPILRVDALKNGSCDLVIIRGEEKAAFTWTVEDLPETLALEWLGYIIYGDTFGTPDMDDDVTVLFNGEQISDYEVIVADESLAEVTRNADGSLHIKALKSGEVEDFLTIEYEGNSWVFGLCV